MRLLIEDARTSSSALAASEKHLANFVAHLQEVARTKTYAYNESSINLPTDKRLFAASQKLAKKLGGRKLKYVVVVGIGGSNLGTKAVYDALHGAFDLEHPQHFPKMLFADTCDARLISALEDVVKSIRHPEEIVVNIVSKSGGTTETAVNADILLATLRKRIKHAERRVVVTTDVGSKLWDLAEKLGMEHLPLPDLVGGRYSVLSPVGLFPLALAGIDTKKLCSGAADMQKHCLDEKSRNNPAMQSATILAAQLRSGKNINDNFFFHPELESLGKWYRQLMGESLGKSKTRSGKKQTKALTPTVSIGSTDLHSMGQLYLGGPKDKVTTFVTSKKTGHAEIPKNGKMSKLVHGIAGKDAADVMRAIFGGVTAAYRKQGVPFMHVELDDLSEKSLGAFLQFKMIEMMFLGEIFDVNAFDQPQVELYKVETKKLLL
ncbi:MAG: hypothetical protein WA001_02925 [Patescibacteria group bacterium]